MTEPKKENEKEYYQTDEFQEAKKQKIKDVRKMGRPIFEVSEDQIGNNDCPICGYPGGAGFCDNCEG